MPGNKARAHAVNLHPKVVRKAIQFAFLPPAVTKAILQGKQPQHVTNCIEIASVEAVDVGIEQRALGFRQDGERTTLGLLHQLAQARAPTIERGLHGGNATVRYIGDLLQRVAEHVHENNAAALRNRQPHEDVHTGGGDLAIVRAACGVNDHIRVLLGVGGVLAGAAPQKVQCRIVGDAK